MTRILVVDDEPDLELLIKQKFRKKINQKEYSFLFARNGVRALEVLQDHQDVDLILADINMPEMDGLTLLSRLNEQDFFLKTLIVSAYGDMQNIRIAMNLGAFDFITKPIDFHDLEVTMEKTINHVIELKKSAETLHENETLKIYLNEIKAQKRVKDKLFAVISHDLRGPVSAMQGMGYVLSMLIRESRYDELEAMIGEVEKTTFQLSRLLDNLLNWASSELNEIPYNPENLSVKEMVKDLYDVFSASAYSKNISLINHIRDDLTIWADQNSAYTIFRNLINNALKFSEENGRIELMARKDGEEVIIDVRDNGIGIPKDKLDSIFKLSAESTFGTKGEKGVGLGLQLVQEFTKMNNGEISLQSEEGKGTTFSISLPSGRT